MLSCSDWTGSSGLVSPGASGVKPGVMKHTQGGASECDSPEAVDSVLGVVKLHGRAGRQVQSSDWLLTLQHTHTHATQLTEAQEHFNVSTATKAVTEFDQEEPGSGLAGSDSPCCL